MKCEEIRAKHNKRRSKAIKKRRNKRKQKLTLLRGKINKK
jgi:hypothetical protein